MNPTWLIKNWKLLTGAGVIVALVIVGATLYFNGSHAGYDKKVTEDAKATVEQVKQTRKTEQKSVDITQVVGITTDVKVRYIYINTNDLLKETFNVPLPSHRCVIPVGLLRVYNAAASGMPSVPDSSGRPDDSDAEFTCTQLVANAIDNYGTALVWKSQVDGWQEWYDKQSTLHRDGY
ncbi:MAG: hypothetical protein GC184_06100 [Rhizobiales bacterium]|nr:hypothetical protein [Hyphomicrobiales bacterium]